jgi:competence protein ComEC
MKRKYVLLFVGFLFAINVFFWKEVFVLAQSNNLEVYFLNVGQGDSAFIKTTENHQIIIDGGPTSVALEKIAKIIPFWDKTIDLVILTHPEKDHMQGLMDILKRYKADYILVSGVLKDSEDYKEWQKILERQKDKGTNVISVKAGDRVILGNALIKILYPLQDFSEVKTNKSTNESCVVSGLFFGKNSFLFTGDISAKNEAEIIGVSRTAITADVLKVAHHGSKYSTSEKFLENFAPRLAVISVGKNSYGHPTQETLQRLEKFGIQILRTDEDGDIKFASDGTNVNIIK